MHDVVPRIYRKKHVSIIDALARLVMLRQFLSCLSPPLLKGPPMSDVISPTLRRSLDQLIAIDARKHHVDAAGLASAASVASLASVAANAGDSHDAGVAAPRTTLDVLDGLPNDDVCRVAALTWVGRGDFPTFAEAYDYAKLDLQIRGKGTLIATIVQKPLFELVPAALRKLKLV